MQNRLEVEWRSFLLRPEPDPNRTLERFKDYTRSWSRAAAEEPEAGFRIWSSDEGPPSHSVPPHLVAKAAARIGAEAFEAMHRRLLEAYFTDNRDITHPDVLAELWEELRLPAEGLKHAGDPALIEQIASEHNDALRRGASGVPATRLGGRSGLLMGAHPAETYRRWVEKALAEEPSEVH